MYDYAIRFEQDTAPGLAVFCRDLPELSSYGDDKEHAIREAVDAIETVLSIYVDQRRVIPQASPAQPGECVISLPAVTVAKIALWNRMMEKGMRKADLCRLLGVNQTQGDRLVDFLHNSKIDAIEQALWTLGRKLAVISMSKDGATVTVQTIQEQNGLSSHLLRRSDTPLEEIPKEITERFDGVPAHPFPIELNGMWLIEQCANDLNGKGWSCYTSTYA